jgi:aminopeptidase N
MRGINSQLKSAAALIATTALAVATAPGAVGAGRQPQSFSPGAPGIGDRLFPTLGNGGYDAKHYALGLRYATRAPKQGVDGTLKMVARSTQALSRFDLDFAGASVGSVSVDGRPAAFRRSGQELVIMPVQPIRKDRLFSVKVTHFKANTTEPDIDQFRTLAFFSTPDGSATVGQPDQSHYIFPSNDHPRDKATFSFRLDVPAGRTAVANGVLRSKRRHGDRTVWTYVQRHPMATELTQLAVGRFTVLRRGSAHGVPVRDVVPTRLVPDYRQKLSVERNHLGWMKRRVGAYPFDLYGSLVVDVPLGLALETQTLSIFDTSLFTDLPRGVWDPVMMHELAHQWFGDSVSPWEWSDVWLNEGHASWYEFTWADARGYLEDDAGFATRLALMRAIYAAGDQFRHEFGPVGLPKSGFVWDVFNPNVYYGGALVLYALRQRVGQSDFQRIERGWVRTYEGRSASTSDFIRLASKVSGQNLHGFLNRWIYGTTTPPMPGHPRWTVDPVSSGSRSAQPNTKALRLPPTASALGAYRHH